MLAFQIFRHSVQQIFGNLDAALKLSWPVLAIGLLQLVMLLLSGVTGVHEQVSPDDPRFATYTTIVFLIMFIYVFVWPWVAVRWHRFVLLNEPQSSTGGSQGRLVFRYLWKGIKISFVLLLIAILPGLVIGAFWKIALTNYSDSDLSVVLILLAPSAIVFLILMSISIRYSSVLPGIALDEALSTFDGWQKTRGYGWMFFVLAIFVAVMGAALSYLPQLLLLLPFPLVINAINFAVISTICDWLNWMINLSVLTTLYGYFFENRALNS